MDELLTEVVGQLQSTFLPHYKEDAFRGLFAGVALRKGWTVVEPRQANATTVQAGRAAVYLLKWKLGSVSFEQGTVKLVKGRPDLRLLSPFGDFFVVEAKCGFTGSASEGNSNSTKIADDVDQVASGDRDLFIGLFDGGMLDRIQGKLSTAGRGAELRALLGGTTMDALHRGGTPLDFAGSWNSCRLTARLVGAVCAGGISLVMVIVRKDLSTAAAP